MNYWLKSVTDYSWEVAKYGTCQINKTNKVQIGLLIWNNTKNAIYSIVIRVGLRVIVDVTL